MRKKLSVLIAAMTMVFLCSCGNGAGNEAATENTANQNLPEEIIDAIAESEDGAYDIQVEEKQIGLSLKEDEFVLGAWHEEGEPVWLVGDEEGNVSLYREGQEREVLLENISTAYVGRASLWRKSGDRFYVGTGNFFVVLKENGELDYQVVLDRTDIISAICATENGEIVIAKSNRGDDYTKLLKLDEATRKFTDITSVAEFYGLAGAEGDCVWYVSGTGLYTFDCKIAEETAYMSWKSTTYSPNGTSDIMDIWRTEDGTILLLKQDVVSLIWQEETLKKVSFEEMGRIILVYKTSIANKYLKEVIAQFNKENDTYYVYLEERNPEVSYSDFVTQVGIEIATDKGPDIIDIGAIDNVASLAKKGVFEDLTPYMQQSGMKREDYFPAALHDFEVEGKCYGFTYGFYLNAVYMKEELADGVTNLETLLSVLEVAGENTVFSNEFGYTPNRLLRYMVCMSPDIYGMLDFENGTCEFDVELWHRMLECAKTYGVKEGQYGLDGLATEVFGGTFQDFGFNDLNARNLGMVPIGYPTEKTMVNQVYSFTLCMNAASENKEGVWEFLQYMMGQQGQKILSEYYFPVLKSEFDVAYREELANPSLLDVVNYDGVYTTKEQVDEIVQLLDNAQCEPINAEYVWSIISEEVAFYFSGEKSIEQVTEIIENRVGLYMAENQ